MAPLELEVDVAEFALLRRKVALITGGCSGIGLATVKLLLQLGMRVAAADINELPEEESTLAEARNQESLTYVKTDVTNWNHLRAFFDSVKARYGQIDCVYANAGVIQNGAPFLDDVLDESGWLQEPDHSTIQVNLISVMNTVKLAIWYMKQGARGGSIVLTGSVASFQRFYPIDYTASKHGLIGFMRALHLHLLPMSIRLNAVAPSWTATGLVPPTTAAAANISLQSSSVVAQSVAMLFAEERRNGQIIYSEAGHFYEVEQSLLEAATQALPKTSGTTHLEECASLLQVFQRSQASQASIPNTAV